MGLKMLSLIKIVKWVGLPLSLIYFYSMVIYPFSTGGDWAEVQKVWHSWQSFNAGVIAFIASLMALFVTGYHATAQSRAAEEQKQRDFLASRAFLPGALTELCLYLDCCYEFLKIFKEPFDVPDDTFQHASTKLPKVPLSIRDSFRDCISTGPEKGGRYLTEILSLLQVQHSRLESIAGVTNLGKRCGIDFENINHSIYDLGKIKAMVNRAFDFARGSDQLDTSSLKWEDFYSAYKGLGIIAPDKDKELFDLTKRKLSKK